MGYNYAQSTIWRHLSSENHGQMIASEREYRARRKAARIKEQRRLEKIRERSIRLRQNHGNEVRRYARNYGRLKRPLAQQQLMAKLHADHPEQTWTLETLTDAIKPYVENVQFQVGTVRKRLLQSYEINNRGPPYIERKGDLFELHNKPSSDHDEPN